MREALKLSMAALVVLASSACGSKTVVPAKTVVIGADLDKTGPLSSPSTEAVVNLAVNQMNTALTTANFKSLQFKVIYGDNQTKSDVAVTRALDLVKNQGAKALLIDGSAVDIAVNRLAYDGDATHALSVPIVGVTNNAPTINNPLATDPDPITQESLHNSQHWNFRTTMSAAIQTVVTARVALDQAATSRPGAGVTYKVETYGVDDAFGHGGAGGLKKQMAAQYPADGGLDFESLYQPSGVDPNSYDYASDDAKLTDGYNENTKVTDGPPDVLVETLSPLYAVAFTKAYVLGGYGLKLVHTAGFQGRGTLDILGDLANNQIDVATPVADGTPGHEFQTQYEAASGNKTFSRDPMLYDGAMLMMLATVQAVASNNLADPTTVTGTQIRDGLLKINDPAGEVVTPGSDFSKVIQDIAAGKTINYQGASGPCDFDANGNVKQRVVQYLVQNKAFTAVKTYDCVASADCPLMQ